MPAFAIYLLLVLIAGTPKDTGIILLDDSHTICCYKGNKYVITQNRVNEREFFWNKPEPAALYLISLETGERRKIAESKNGLLLHATLSPEENFAIWYDQAKARFCIYQISIAVTRQLPGSIIAIPRWLAGDQLLIAYDEYDIWKFNPVTLQSTCITEKYGRKHKTIFRLLTDSMLIAFNTKSKKNGFWQMSSSTPRCLTMDDCLYYFPVHPLDEYQPLKAKNANTWLLYRQYADSPPILYTTTDFREFRPLSTPSQTNGSATLLHFKGITGILYKPVPFKPQNKYPLILTAYGKYSDNLHHYIPLQHSDGTLNIPWYTTNGYLVFVPDITTKKGNPGPGIARTIIKSVHHLKKYPFVDGSRIGIQGHSFGGWITNYIITHTNLFAAAQESAGPTDFISGYGSIRKQTGATLQPVYETGQNNMGHPPWEKTRKYVKNSPVLRADHITTPLLMLHNEDDNAVPFSQAVELFTALRRLQQPVWLLKYRNEGHQLQSFSARLDFTRKQQEFFDHYLKGKPAPEWMQNLQEQPDSINGPP